MKNKKIFIAGKTYDLQAMDKDTIEASVQEYLDNAIGKDRVRFRLYTAGNMVSMFFHRGFDYTPYHADPEKEIMDPDAFLITCHGYDGFLMPEPFPTIPSFGYPCRIDQGDFLDAYRKSAKELGANRIKEVSLDITPHSVVLRVRFK